jgi:farnesyl diphosphate synthase
MSKQPADLDFTLWSRACADRVEQALERFLPPVGQASARLHEAMRYAVLGGGKRVRPLLVHAAGVLTGAAPDALDRAACAVELIHAYSLVHDDLPCMDNDVLRRGKPTVHVAYGEALAMLVGDALQALAFEVLAGAADHRPGAVAARMVGDLARAAGSQGMAGGQAIDLASVGVALTRPELEAMHRLKTGALLAVSVQLGAACGAPIPDPGRQAALERFAATVGLAFQVVDDVLDVAADSVTLGKTAGKDQQHNKPTYVSLMGLEPARALARELHDQARQQLAILGPGARRLAELTDLIVHRSH